MDTLVSVSWLAEHLNDPELALIDCRFILGEPDKGREAYGAGHIPGAVYFDLEKDLSGAKGEHGGRHPWPNPEDFIKKLGGAGINQNTSVVLYDDQKGAMAPRCYWLLRYVGHKNAALLDGGLAAWQKAGLPVTDEITRRSAVHYEPDMHHDLLRTVEDVRNSTLHPEAVLIDSRAFERYTGAVEPIDAVGGHIPGALHYDWQDVVTGDGSWRTGRELAEHFAQLPRDRELIVYCGSGVTACANLFALETAGYKNMKLYPGSWSDWITYPEHGIVKGDKK
ncbi:sulfurtransferase [Aneurinibacillus tyrosinisolvens]|uniref:sulfurtransferase n=1 Tax=Aneurinibacillus tyrosinisolvens TaxID=1443435 RepID=UPI00063F9F28|nr:sulfurtransferase [Aneurinibacillus tyrosinisolvens]